MGERKGVSKYFPPDFDPSKLPRVRRPKNRQMKVRNMLPMSIRCHRCGNYMYEGTKFNACKEDVIGETYLGIQKFRFYFKCKNCSAEIALKTDPENSDYVVESGARRNFEPWRAEDEMSESGDAIKYLENRMLSSKRKMNIHAAIDELKSMKSQRATVSVDAILEALKCAAAEKEKKIEEEDEALIKLNFQRPKEVVRGISDEVLDDDRHFTLLSSGNGENSNDGVKRRKVSGEVSGIATGALTKTSFLDDSSSKETSSVSGTREVKAPFKSSVMITVVKKKPDFTVNGDTTGNSEEKKQEEKVANNTSTGLQSLCQSYESDED